MEISRWRYSGWTQSGLREKNLRTQSARGPHLHEKAGMIKEARRRNCVWEGTSANPDSHPPKEGLNWKKETALCLLVRDFLARCLSPSGAVVTPVSQPGVQ